MYKFIKPIIFFIALLISSYLYSNIPFDDIRSKSIVYFAYGIENQQNLVVILRWYFGICILFCYLYRCYKNEITSNRINYLVRSKSKRVFNLKILSKTIKTALFCWITILAVMTSFKICNDSMSFSFQDVIIIISSGIAIITLVTIYLILDSLIDSSYAFMIVNICIIFGIAFSNLCDVQLIKCLFTPNLLMPLQFNNIYLFIGIIVGIIIEIVLTIVYLNITEKKDILAESQ